MVGWDPAGPTLWKCDTAEDELSGTYGAMLILAKITRLMNSKAKLHHDKDNKRKRSLASRADVVDYLVPYSYVRVFHPQIPLHKKIASLVVFQMSMDHDARRGYATWTNLNQNTCCALCWKYMAYTQEVSTQQTAPDRILDVPGLSGVTS
ncbi:unnamed protein product [Fusarium graminearum]|nr:unnamed protein product [Fusarium graminearum]